MRGAAATCTSCVLHEKRKQAVLGVGDEKADWLFVGEGPGAEEDMRGEPFVGQAGKLLDNMLSAIGLKRGNNVYIANVVKCRPPGNRNPAPEETLACQPFLDRQIALLQPRLVVALGKVAANTLLAHGGTLGSMRKTVHDYRGIPEALGWHNQLENEIAFAIVYEHKHRIDYWADAVGYDTDIIIHAGAAAGTVFTYANTGIEVRTGWQLPQNFGTSLIRPGGDVSDPYIKNNMELKNFSLYLFTAVSGRYVLRDIFLDGNTFRDSHSVEKQNLVADIILGASMQFGKIALTYAQVFRSCEYKTQKSRHNFGSINLSINHAF